MSDLAVNQTISSVIEQIKNSQNELLKAFENHKELTNKSLELLEQKKTETKVEVRKVKDQLTEIKYYRNLFEGVKNNLSTGYQGEYIIRTVMDCLALYKNEKISASFKEIFLEIFKPCLEVKFEGYFMFNQKIIRETILKVRDIRWLLLEMIKYPQIFPFVESDLEIMKAHNASRDNIYIVKRAIKKQPIDFEELLKEAKQEEIEEEEKREENNHENVVKFFNKLNEDDDVSRVVYPSIIDCKIKEIEPQNNIRMFNVEVTAKVRSSLSWKKSVRSANLTIDEIRNIKPIYNRLPKEIKQSIENGNESIETKEEKKEENVVVNQLNDHENVIKFFNQLNEDDGVSHILYPCIINSKIKEIEPQNNIRMFNVEVTAKDRELLGTAFLGTWKKTVKSANLTIDEIRNIKPIYNRLPKEIKQSIENGNESIETKEVNEEIKLVLF